MKNLEYLFSFDFEKGCKNDYLVKFCNETKTDYFYSHLGIFCADLYGTGIYYKLVVIGVKNNRQEVYYIKNDTVELTDAWARKYPLGVKAVRVEPYENAYVIKATFVNGDSITTRINGHKKMILEHYIGHVFDMSGDAEKESFVKCIDVEFLEVIGGIKND